MVPVFEEYAAMIAAHYTEDAWHAAGWEIRARAVAFMRLSALKRLHEEDARIKHSEKKSKRR